MFPEPRAPGSRTRAGATRWPPARGPAQDLRPPRTTIVLRAARCARRRAATAVTRARIGGLRRPGQQPGHQLGAFACHPRAWDDELQTGVFGALAGADVDVGVEAQRACPPAPRSGSSTIPAPSRDSRSGPRRATAGLGPRALASGRRHRPASTSCPAAASAPDPRSEQEVRGEEQHGHVYCARRRRNSSRAEWGRPHRFMTSTRPLRVSRTTISPSKPASSSRPRAPWTVWAAAA